MKIEIKKPVDLDVRYLQITFRNIESWSKNQFARKDNYSGLLGNDDPKMDIMPFRFGDNWAITIDLGCNPNDEWIVTNWNDNICVQTDMKVLGGYDYRLMDSDLNTIIDGRCDNGVPYFIASTKYDFDGWVEYYMNKYDEFLAENIVLDKIGIYICTDGTVDGLDFRKFWMTKFVQQIDPLKINW